VGVAVVAQGIPFVQAATLLALNKKPNGEQQLAKLADTTLSDLLDLHALGLVVYRRGQWQITNAGFGSLFYCFARHLEA
jgi:hypothetical protein